jgi:hypothetical protein
VRFLFFLFETRSGVLSVILTLRFTERIVLNGKTRVIIGEDSDSEALTKMSCGDKVSTIDAFTETETFSYTIESLMYKI